MAIGSVAALMKALNLAGKLSKVKSAAAATQRLAGPALTKAKAAMGPRFTQAFPGGGKDMLYSALPDIGFGALTGMMTPGDLGDKFIAGATDAAVGAGLTGGLRGVIGARPGTALSTAIEYGGGMATGFASQPVSEALLRLKGGGLSPYDKLQQEQYAGIRQQVEEEVYQQLMAGNRSPYIGDPFGGNYG